MKPAFQTALFLCLSICVGAPAYAACSLVKITQMPLIALGNHVAVMAQIRDVERPMIVDTGAATTIFTTRFVEKSKLKQDEVTPPTRSIGIGQTTGDQHFNVIPSVLGLGDLVLHDRSTAVTEMDFGKLPEQAAAGLIGDDILSQYDVEFDFSGKTLSFYSAFDCYDTFIPYTGPFSQIPFDHHEAKIVMDVILNDIRTRAIVDTGNNMSFVERQSPVLWHVSDDELIETKAKSTSPLNGGTSQAIKLYRFKKLSLGDETFSQRTIGIVDVDLLTGTANFGLDYFKDHKLWISYHNQLMFVARQPALSKLAYPVIPKHSEAMN